MHIGELEKYKINDHFFFFLYDDLKQVCNAPSDKSGVYYVYALKNGKIELVYIGCSGKLQEDGKMFVRKAGLGGIKDRLVNGHQFGKIPRKKSWPNQMRKENIEVLDIYWYATHDNKYCDCPKLIESKLLKNYFEIMGGLPKWNRVIY